MKINVDQLKKIQGMKYAAIIKDTLKEIHLILAMIICVPLKIKNNKIVFSSFHGTQYNAQPRAISDLMKNSSNYDIVWILPNNATNTCSKFRHVPTNSIRSIFELMTANVWVDNCRKPYWLYKKKGQLYIQTWHGPVCLKAVERDAEDTLPAHYVISAKCDSKKTDYIVAESAWRRRNITDAFWYNGKIIDATFDYNTAISVENEDKVKKYFDFPDGSKILLYVPTFRRDHSINNYLQDFEQVLKALNELDGSDWRVIIRLHPNIQQKASFINYNDYVKNGTQFPKVDELIKAADLVVSDYSGCIFDSFRAKKPVVLFAKDYDDYIKKERGLYFQLDQLPSPLVKTEGDLKTAFVQAFGSEYQKKLAAFLDVIGYYQEDAAQKCMDLIIEHCEKELV